jgi:hypothetical protein
MLMRRLPFGQRDRLPFPDELLRRHRRIERTLARKALHRLA